MITKYFRPYEYGQSRIHHRIHHHLNCACVYVYNDERILHHKVVGRYDNAVNFWATELVKSPLPRQFVSSALKNRQVGRNGW